MTASAVADVIGAQLEGNPERTLRGLASPSSATEDDLIVVFSAAGLRERTKAQVAVVHRGCTLPDVETHLYVEEPRIALARLSGLFAPASRTVPGRHPTACISPDAYIDPTASVGPFCVVEPGARVGAETRLVSNVYVAAGVYVGARCLMLPGVVLYPGTVIGDRVTIHANSAVGVDGYAYVTEDPSYPKVYSLGGVFVEDDVEIGAGTGIQRGTLDWTSIGRGTKIGSQVEIAHNCRIGEYCLLVGKLTIAGSVTLGDRVFVAAGACIRDHVSVGSRSKIMMCAAVTRDLPEGSTVLGSPAQDHELEKTRYRVLSRLAREVGGIPLPSGRETS